MKKVLIILLMASFLISCQKAGEPGENYTGEKAVVSGGSGIGPLNMYRWTSMEVPQVNTYPYTRSEMENLVIPVGEDIYLVAGTYLDFRYKLNNTTKKWEVHTTTNSGYMGFASFTVGFQYLFSYGGQIYLGLMQNGPSFNETYFGTMDPVTGVTHTKATFPGITTANPVCFVLGSKGYLISGYTAQSPSQVWEYNFITDQWTNKGVSPLGNRDGAVAMVANGKVYLGLGYITQTLNGTPVKLYKKDWIEYTPGSSFNISKADFPGAARSFAKGFVLNGNPYLGLGERGTTYYTDFWKYDPASNSWAQQDNVPGYTPDTPKNSGCFVSGTAGYVVKGVLAEFWRFSQSSIVAN